VVVHKPPFSLFTISPWELKNNTVILDYINERSLRPHPKKSG
jgi:hypothetical protein